MVGLIGTAWSPSALLWSPTWRWKSHRLMLIVEIEVFEEVGHPVERIRKARRMSAGKGSQSDGMWEYIQAKIGHLNVNPQTVTCKHGAEILQVAPPCAGLIDSVWAEEHNDNVVPRYDEYLGT